MVTVARSDGDDSRNFQWLHVGLRCVGVQLNCLLWLEMQPTVRTDDVYEHQEVCLAGESPARSPLSALRRTAGRNGPSGFKREMSY